jgi:hypothetical protein
VQQIREAAKHERRTISGFILNTVMSRISSSGKAAQSRAATGTKTPEEGGQ